MTEPITRLPPPPFWRTRYYETSRSKPGRAAISYDDVAAVLAAPYRSEWQPDGRIRHWGRVQRLGRWLRVVTQENGETVPTAFLDRGLNPDSPDGSRRRARAPQKSWRKRRSRLSPVAYRTIQPPTYSYLPDPSCGIRAGSQPTADPSGESGIRA